MRRGALSRAWEISDAQLRARLARGEPAQVGPRHLQHIWNGEPLAGKRVLVRCYHGLGDTVQFIRFAAPLRRLAKEVIIWAQPQLVSLVSTAPGVDRVLPLHDGAPDVDYDIDIEIMELAHAFRADAQSIPREVPYLFPTAGKRRLRKPSHERAVGLVWQAGDWDPRRSLPGALLFPLAAMSEIRLFSLQRGPAAADAAQISADDISSDDLDRTIAALRSLDLLITVDTFLAHLAGALGLRVWLLLHTRCDWRWMEGGTRCIWYPTMRIFRQPTAGAWRPVVASVERELRSHLADESQIRRSEQTMLT